MREERERDERREREMREERERDERRERERGWCTPLELRSKL